MKILIIQSSLYNSGLTLLNDLEKEDFLYSIAVVDRQLNDINGDDIIKALKKKYPQRPVICSSGWLHGYNLQM